MPSKKRNYAAEYARRIARGLAKGLSRSQARGHPRAGEAFVGIKSTASTKPAATINPNRPEERALRLMKKGASLKDAAAGEKISQERLRRYLKQHTHATRVGRRWQIIDNRARQFPFYSEGRLVSPWLTPEEASQAGRFMQAVKSFLSSGEAEILKDFRGHGVRDISGTFHPFETDPNTLYELDFAGELSFPEIYKIAV